MKLNSAKPFLKWAGGKGQLLDSIRNHYPFYNKKFTKYAEPFVGGGAVLFDILCRYDLQEVYISDINAELINAYCIIRDNVNDLIEILATLQNEFILLNPENRKIYYLERRKQFNKFKINGNQSDNLKKAALMIFLNKTCFNGLYRVNKKFKFNVQMGAYKNPLICDKQNLLAVSEKLQKVKIVCTDYKASDDFIDEKTFVYFDPPYRPITETSSFTAYTENSFNDESQKELAKYINKLHEKGAKFVISNSDPKNTNENEAFFDILYEKYSIERVNAKRAINCKGLLRNHITELLISN